MKNKEEEMDLSFINLESMETIILSDAAFAEFERLNDIASAREEKKSEKLYRKD